MDQKMNIFAGMIDIFIKIMHIFYDLMINNLDNWQYNFQNVNN